MNTTLTKIRYNLVEHRGEKRIAIVFAFDAVLVERVRKLENVRWSKTLSAWHVPDTEKYRTLFKLPLGNDFTVKKEAPILAQKKVDNTPAINYKGNLIHVVNAAVLAEVKQQLVLKAYAQNTQRTYLNEISIFLQHIKHRDAAKLTTQNIKDYLQYCFEKLKLSENTLHSRLNALKFYYEQVLHNKKIFFDIPRPKKPQQLPKVLNETELKRLFDSANNLKHKALLFVAYSAGLRVSEVINLRIQDIDRERGQMFIHCSKGKKDRYVHLSPLVLDILEQYYRMWPQKPREYIFESHQLRQQYSIRSAQQIFSDCKTKAGILKSVSFHSLRHSFATHVLERGIDVMFIKDILGHFNIKTTQRYLHVRRDFLINIPSPIDSLYK